MHILDSEDLIRRQNILVDVLDAAVSDDPAEGLLHGGRSSTDAAIAIDHHADTAQRFDPLGVEVVRGKRGAEALQIVCAPSCERR